MFSEGERKQNQKSVSSLSETSRSKTTRLLRLLRGSPKRPGSTGRGWALAPVPPVFAGRAGEGAVQEGGEACWQAWREERKASRAAATAGQARCQALCPCPLPDPGKQPSTLGSDSIRKQRELRLGGPLVGPGVEGSRAAARKPEAGNAARFSQAPPARPPPPRVLPARPPDPGSADPADAPPPCAWRSRSAPTVASWHGGCFCYTRLHARVVREV